MLNFTQCASSHLEAMMPQLCCTHMRPNQNVLKKLHATASSLMRAWVVRYAVVISPSASMPEGNSMFPYLCTLMHLCCMHGAKVLPTCYFMVGSSKPRG